VPEPATRVVQVGASAPGPATADQAAQAPSPGSHRRSRRARLQPGSTLDDNVRLALLVVLQRLTPAERVVFVLHDIFAVPFGSIAQTVGRSAAS
jgi:DNA-directed RNA polymerase specialized sigma24 family protein